MEQDKDTTSKREKVREALTQQKGVNSLAERVRKQQEAVDALLGRDTAGAAEK